MGVPLVLVESTARKGRSRVIWGVPSVKLLSLVLVLLASTLTGSLANASTATVTEPSREGTAFRKILQRNPPNFARAFMAEFTRLAQISTRARAQSNTAPPEYLCTRQPHLIANEPDCVGEWAVPSIQSPTAKTPNLADGTARVQREP
jgi:hypothetical protein